MATGPGNPLNITGTGAISFNGTIFHGGTLPVIYGGTGNTTFTAYSVITAGTTATGAFQNVSGVGTSGQVLTSNGAGMLPSWASSSSGVTTVAIQVFTSNGTYTPTTNMAYCIVELIGGGGGGGGAQLNAAGHVSVGGGGGGAGYCRKVYSAAGIGASQSVSIGAGGPGNPAADGSNGGNSTFIGLTAFGGSGGSAGTSSTGTTNFFIDSGTSGGATGGDVNVKGGNGIQGQTNGIIVFSYASGDGGSSYLGGGAKHVYSDNPGINAVTQGSGGGGASGAPSGGGGRGGNGGGGICIITEYIT